MLSQEFQRMFLGPHFTLSININTCVFNYQLYNKRLEPRNLIEANCVPTVLKIPIAELREDDNI